MRVLLRPPNVAVRLLIVAVVVVAMGWSGTGGVDATPGDPAPGFGVDGTVRLAVGGPLRDAVTSDVGVTYVAGCSRPAAGSGSANILAVTVWAFGADGEPLAGFGANGVVRTPVGANEDCAQAIAIDADGNLLLAGTSVGLDGITKSLLLIRLDGSTGALDRSFGTDGATTVGGAPTSYLPAAVAAGASSIVVAGGTSTPGAPDAAALWRFDADGRLDAGFGPGGIATFAPAGTNSASLVAVSVRPTGEIVATGNIATSTPSAGDRSEALMLQVTSSGSADGSFGSNGVRIIGALSGGPGFGDRSTSTEIQVRDAVLAADGDLVVVGRRSGARTSNPVVLRLDDSGVLDLAFGSGGVRNLDVNDPHGGFASAVSFDAAGNILVGGSGFDGELRRGFVHRLTPDGADDGGFGDLGRQYVADALSPRSLSTVGNDIAVTGIYSRLSQLIALSRLVDDGGPVAPQGVVAVPFGGGAAIGWEPSAGGPQVERYTVIAEPGGATCTTSANRCDIDGLADGTTYRFTVVAEAAAGAVSRPSKPSNPVTPPDSFLATAGPLKPPNLIPGDACAGSSCPTVFVELALVLDGSDSYAPVFADQVANYRDLFADPTFFETFVEPLPDQAIAVSLYQLGSNAAGNYRQEVGWQIIDSQADADAFGAAVGGVTFIGGLSPIWDAVAAARTDLRSNAIQGRYLTIDIDSDGLTTGGTVTPLRAIRDAKLRSEIDAINALVSPADTDASFDDFHLGWAVEIGLPDNPVLGFEERWTNPDGGPGRLFVAATFAEHAAVLRSKLAAEISPQPDLILEPDPPQLPDPPTPATVPPTTEPTSTDPPASVDPPTTDPPVTDPPVSVDRPTTAPPVVVPSSSPSVSTSTTSATSITTTTTVSPIASPAPTTTAPAPAPTPEHRPDPPPTVPVPDLPVTGAWTQDQLRGAVALVLLGVVLVAVARRRAV